MKTEFYIEITDTFSDGETMQANYSWVRRYCVLATTDRGAMRVVSRHYGHNWRFDGVRWNAQGACICAFVTDEPRNRTKYEYLNP